jgi:hypothetical protein
MSPDVRELIEKKPFCREGLRGIAALLPESDAELASWLRKAIDGNAAEDFIYLIFAAAMSGRKLNADLLQGGATLLPDDWRFAWIAWRMEGDVVGALLHAAAFEAIPMSRRAMALFLAAAWMKEHRPDEELPSRLMIMARKISTGKPSPDTIRMLAALAFLLGADLFDGLPTLGGTRLSQRKREAALAEVFECIRGPFDALIPEQLTAQFTQSGTQRRAVERIGRNEKCPCGSGRKYKVCCEEKDRERLSIGNASDVAGKTRAEVAQDLNADLTKERLSRLAPSDTLKLDPTRVPTELQQDYLLRLYAFGQLEALADAFEKLGVPDHLQHVWGFSAGGAVSWWRRDILMRLLDLWPEAESVLGERSAGITLLMASNDPATFLETLEAEALDALRSGNPERIAAIGEPLMQSPHRALGILVARGALPIVDSKAAAELFEDILIARGRLDIPADDELADLMEERAARERETDSSEALEEARAKLEAKAEEVRQTKEVLARLQRDIVLGEKRERRESRTLPSVEPPGDKALGDLRSKVSELKGLLKERGEERVALRQELAALHKEMSDLPSAPPVNGEMKSADDDEQGELLEVSGHQPVRLIEFPKKFAETLAAFPQHVGRIAMSSIGRIASGDANALMGLVKIYDCEKVVRLRLAGDYRLLLQLLPDRVRVIDLVNRKDLQRRLKVLRTTGVPP